MDPSIRKHVTGREVVGSVVGFEGFKRRPHGGEGGSESNCIPVGMETRTDGYFSEKEDSFRVFPKESSELSDWSTGDSPLMSKRSSCNAWESKNKQIRSTTINSPSTTGEEEHKIHGCLSEWNVDDRPPSSKPAEDATNSTYATRRNLEFGDVESRSGSINFGTIRVSGYTIEDDESITPASQETLQKAVSALQKVLKGVSLSEEVPAYVKCEVVGMVPGSTSDSCEVRVWEEGKWKKLRDESHTSLADLAKVNNHSLNMNNVLELADKKDAELANMLRFFCTKNDTSHAETKDPDISTSKITHTLNENDLEMLQEAGVIRRLCGRESRPKYALYSFKVPKKVPNEARFITDCRELNSSVTLFKNTAMNIPHLHQVMRWGVGFNSILSVDANAFFFQFRLEGPRAKWFPLKASIKRGKFKQFYIEKLPMGFCLAPAIAQRTSNLITAIINERIAKAKIEAVSCAWVDNFIVFAKNDNEANLIMSWMLDELKNVDIECKKVDASGEILGMVKTNMGLGLKDEFKEKLSAQLQHAQKESLNLNEQQKLAGNIMWLNYTVARIPLACMPHTLKWLRDMGSDIVADLKTPELQNELIKWKSVLNSTYKQKTEQHNNKKVWSDATPSMLAIVIENLVLIAKINGEGAIALMETVAAGWGIIFCDKKADTFLDNQCAAFAYAKGHCSSEAINKVLNNVFEGEPLEGDITWVPSEDQIADGPTRDKLVIPENRFNFKKREIWMHLESSFFSKL